MKDFNIWDYLVIIPEEDKKIVSKEEIEKFDNYIKSMPNTWSTKFISTNIPKNKFPNSYKYKR